MLPAQPPHELLGAFVEQADDLAESKEQKQLVRDLTQEASELVEFVETAKAWEEYLVSHLMTKLGEENGIGKAQTDLDHFRVGRRAAYREILELLGERT